MTAVGQRLTRRQLLGQAALAVGIAAAVALWARYGLIESSETSAFCFARADATTVPFRCLVRNGLVQVVGTVIPGVGALLLGVAALVVRGRGAILAALAAGAAGIVLYAGLPAAAGFLCGWITLARFGRAERDAAPG